MTTAQVAIDAGGDPVPAAPAPASPPAAPAYSWPVALAYIGVSLFVALTQGVAQGFVSTNIPQVAGNLGRRTPGGVGTAAVVDRQLAFSTFAAASISAGTL